MKYIVFGDLHIGLKQSSEAYLDISKRFISDVCDYARENDIYKCTIAGDLFDNRKNISLSAMNTALSIGSMLQERFQDTYIIIGNHDMMYNDSMDITSVSLFKEFSNITIIDRPRTTDGIQMLPWLFDKSILETSDADICIGHFALNGISLNASGTVAEGFNLNQSDFNKFDTVLSGHFHTPGKYGNIQYMGSPFQTNFNDIGNVTGFYVLDTVTGTVEFIEWNDYPKHIRVKDVDEVNPDVITGSIVELYFTKDHGIDENKVIVDKWSDCKPFKLIVKYLNTNTTFTDESIDDDISMKDALELLIEYFGKAELTEGLSHNMIDAVIRKLYKEVVDES